MVNKDVFVIVARLLVAGVVVPHAKAVGIVYRLYGHAEFAAAEADDLTWLEFGFIH